MVILLDGENPKYVVLKGNQPKTLPAQIRSKTLFWVAWDALTYQGGKKRFTLITNLLHRTVKERPRRCYVVALPTPLTARKEALLPLASRVIIKGKTDSHPGLGWIRVTESKSSRGAPEAYVPATRKADLKIWNRMKRRANEEAQVRDRYCCGVALPTIDYKGKMETKAPFSEPFFKDETLY